MGQNVKLHERARAAAAEAAHLRRERAILRAEASATIALTHALRQQLREERSPSGVTHDQKFHVRPQEVHPQPSDIATNY